MTVQPTANDTPVTLVNLNPKTSPRVEMIKTPKKLIIIARMLADLIFCLSKGIDSKTSIIGQMKVKTSASWAGSIEYAFNRTT